MSSKKDAVSDVKMSKSEVVEGNTNDVKLASSRDFTGDHNLLNLPAPEITLAESRPFDIYSSEL